MLRRLFILAAVLFVCRVHAQVNDVAFAAVRYHFTHLSDTTMSADTENMILYLGKQFSVYKSYDKMLSDSVMKAQIEQYKNVPPESIQSIRIGAPGMKFGSPSMVFKNVETGKLQRVEVFMGTYLVDEAAPVIDWNMLQETKDIQGLNCQKATTRFRGRNYTAWFAPSIPYSNGPWKLGGLPGLIVEAYDDEQQVVFRFAGYEDVSAKNVAITFPTGRIIPTTDKDFRQMRASADKDPQGFMKSRMAELQSSGINISVSVGSPMRTSGTPAKRRVINNPIEREGN